MGDDAEWECYMCMMTNPESSEVCESCDEPRLRPGEGVSDSESDQESVETPSAAMAAEASPPARIVRSEEPSVSHSPNASFASPNTVVDSAEVKELNTTVRKLTEQLCREKEDRKREVATLDEMLSAMATQEASLKSQVNAQSVKLAGSEKRLEDAKHKEAEAVKRGKALEKELAQLRGDHDKLLARSEKTVAATAGEKDALAGDMERLKKQVDSHKDAAKAAEQRVADVLKELSDAKSNAKQLGLDVARLTKAENEHLKESEGKVKGFEKKIAEAQERHARLSKEKENTEQELEAALDDASELKRKLSAIEQQTSEALQNSDKQAGETTTLLADAQKEAANLQKQLKEATNEKQAAERELADVRNEATELKQKLAAAVQETSEAKQSSEKRANETAKQLTDSQNEVANLQVELKKALDGKQSAEQELKQKLAAVAQETSEAKQGDNQRASEMADMKQQVAKLQTDLKTALDEKQRAEQELKQKLSAAEQNGDERAAEVATQLSDLQKEVARLQTELKAAENEKETAEARARETSESKQGSDKRAGDTTKQLADLQKQLANLETDAATRQAKAENAQQSLREEAAALKQQLSDASQKRDAAEQAAAELRKKFDDLAKTPAFEAKPQSNEAELLLGALQSELAACKEKLERQDADICKLGEANARALAEKAEVSAELEASANRLSRVEAELTAARADLVAQTGNPSGDEEGEAVLLRKKLSDMQSERDKTRMALMAVQDVNTVLNRDLSSTKEDLLHTLREFEATQTHLHAVEHSLDDRDNTVSSLNLENADLRRSLRLSNDATPSLQTQETDEIHRLTAHVSRLQTEISNYQKRIATAEEAAAREATRNERLSSNLEQKTEQLQAAQHPAAAAAAPAGPPSTLVAALELKLKDTQAKLQTVSAENERVVKLLASAGDLNLGLTEKEARLKEQVEKVRTLEAKLQSTAEEGSDKEALRKRLQETEDAQRAAMAQKDTQVRVLMHQIKVTEQNWKEAEKSAAAALAEVEELKQHQAAGRAAPDADGDDAWKKTLTTELAGLKDMLDVHDPRGKSPASNPPSAADQTARIDELAAQLKDRDSELQALHSELKSLRERLESDPRAIWARDGEELPKDVADLFVKVKGLSTQVVELRKQLIVAEGTSEQRQRDNDELRASLDSHKPSTRHSLPGMAKLRVKQNPAAESASEALLKAEVKQLRQQLDEKAKEITAVRATAAVVKHLKSEVKDLKLLLSDKEAEMAVVRGKATAAAQASSAGQPPTVVAKGYRELKLTLEVRDREVAALKARLHARGQVNNLPSAGRHRTSCNDAEIAKAELVGARSVIDGKDDEIADLKMRLHAEQRSAAQRAASSIGDMARLKKQVNALKAKVSELESCQSSPRSQRSVAFHRTLSNQSSSPRQSSAARAATRSPGRESLSASQTLKTFPVPPLTPPLGLVAGDASEAELERDNLLAERVLFQKEIQFLRSEIALMSESAKKDKDLSHSLQQQVAKAEVKDKDRWLHKKQEATSYKKQLEKSIDESVNLAAELKSLTVKADRDQKEAARLREQLKLVRNSQKTGSKQWSLTEDQYFEERLTLKSQLDDVVQEASVLGKKVCVLEKELGNTMGRLVKEEEKVKDAMQALTALQSTADARKLEVDELRRELASVTDEYDKKLVSQPCSPVNTLHTPGALVDHALALSQALSPSSQLSFSAANDHSALEEGYKKLQADYAVSKQQVKMLKKMNTETISENALVVSELKKTISSLRKQVAAAQASSDQLAGARLLHNADKGLLEIERRKVKRLQTELMTMSSLFPPPSLSGPAAIAHHAKKTVSIITPSTARTASHPASSAGASVSSDTSTSPKLRPRRTSSSSGRKRHHSEPPLRTTSSYLQDPSPIHCTPPKKRSYVPSQSPAADTERTIPMAKHPMFDVPVYKTPMSSYLRNWPLASRTTERSRSRS
ncbi:hypothetical protein DIPPA_09558 [Diplonema papillatum]|nr:hypothetical protein DIPPA_09558 [Diplonema papillatum]